MYIRHEIALSKWVRVTLQFNTCSMLVRYCTVIKRKHGVSRRRRNAGCVLEKAKSSSLSNVLNYRKLTFERTVEHSFVFSSLTHLICSLVTLFSFLSIASSPKRECPFGCSNQLVTTLGCSYMQFNEIALFF